MTITSKELTSAFIAGILAVFFALWMWAQKRRARENEKISEVLRRRV